MEDEVAESMLQSHFSHCEACRFIVSMHGMNGSIKDTMDIVHKRIKDHEKESGREYKI